MPAFQPYWGKLAVRNDRGDRGNVGIIRSPIRASILPDPSRHSAECRVASITPTTVDGLPTCRVGVTHGESHKDASSDVTTVGTGSSTLRQPRLAHPINMMLEVLGVLVDENTSRAFDCETGIDPQHLRGFGSRLLKLSRLSIGA